jgi:hypothetical protein
MKLRSTIMLILGFISTSVMAEVSDMDVNKIRLMQVETITKNKLISYEEDDLFSGGFNELVPYIVPAPYQSNAGSCLYMSHTGIIEWWLNRLNEFKGNRKVDLSERYYMALKTQRAGQDNIKNWRTDNIERLNVNRNMFLNSQYKFTKGNFKVVDGTRVATHENDEQAQYGTKFNWIDKTETITAKNSINLPNFKREILLVDQEENQWNVATAPLDIVDTVKNALVKNRAPVLVIYNHQGFWHANIIFGFNDNYPTKGCPFVSGFKPYMDERARGMEKEAQETDNLKEKKRLLKKAKNFRSKGNKVAKRFDEIGGCASKGVFYVRDSIFPNKDMPLYDYDLNKEGEEKHLNSPLILREYDWLTTTANHVIQIMPLYE